MNHMSSDRVQARSDYVQAWGALLQHESDTTVYAENEQVISRLEYQYSFTAIELRTMRMRARACVSKK